MKPSIILASSSKYRKALLSRLTIDFDCLSPEIDETPLLNESAKLLATRLSLQKAKEIAESHIGAWVIGSDQVASSQEQIIGKPNNFANAFEQLKSFSGKSVKFYTAVTLLNMSQEFCMTEVSKVDVFFRNLTDNEIERYLKLEQPYDCAGSFKVESLGISLFESVESSDPTSLEGLPLISLCRLFAKAGLKIL